MSFLTEREITCPANLLALAKTGTPPKVVIARAGAKLPMAAAKQAVEAGIMEPVFVGETDLIDSEAEALAWDISRFQVVSAVGEADAAQKAAAICGAGDGDILMKGHLHTDVFMKSVLTRENSLRTDNRLVHLFLMTAAGSDQPLVLSDCAVNISPDMATKQAALRYCVEMLQMIGEARPKVAILSATESAIPSMPSSMEAADLAAWAAEAVAGADVSGPLALDLILSKESVKIKGLTNDPVAGKATGIIVPDIVSGNVLFKSLVYLSGACAAGIVMGAKVPVLLSSRADPPAARLASVALAAIMAKSRN
ncbi:MAG: phosphate acetyltransferase [Rhodobacteraceae bacterium]|nr:phosphate acetyltransferase [Paracoccaceae bacterium]